LIKKIIHNLPNFFTFPRAWCLYVLAWLVQRSR
jgi:hypothetical protein